MADADIGILLIRLAVPPTKTHGVSRPTLRSEAKRRVLPTFMAKQVHSLHAKRPNLAKGPRALLPVTTTYQPKVMSGIVHGVRIGQSVRWVHDDGVSFGSVEAFQLPNWLVRFDDDELWIWSKQTLAKYLLYEPAMLSDPRYT